MKIQSRLHNPTPITAGRFLMTPCARRESGSTLIAALVTLTVLALIAASTFLTVTHRYRANFQTASWHDALTSAEDGAQYALVRLRSPLTKTDPSINASSSSTTSTTTTPNTPNQNQVLVDPDLVPGSLQYDLAKLKPGDISTNGTIPTTFSYTRIQLPTLTIPHIGQGSSQFSAVVTVDAVPNTGLNGSSTWYRIQSVGTVPLPGNASAGIQKYDNLLRKLQFRSNGTGAGNNLTTAQAVRTIEIIAKPVSIGSAALFGKSGINLNNKNVVIDSYDSRNPGVTSNADGTYNASKATKSANVVTDDIASASGSPGVINLSSTGAYVNGNIATNDTPVKGDTSHVSGTITEDFFQYLPNPPDPGTMGVTWASFPSASGNINLDTTTGTKTAPLRYKVDGTGNNGTSLGLQNNELNITGNGYIEIWIPGGLSVNGNAAINIPNGATVTFYVDGKVDITGNGVLNSSTIPGRVTFYGNPDPASSQSISVAGNADFAGIIYAPNSDVNAQGGGNSGAIYGSIVAKTIFFNGGTTLHYDQALGDLGAVIDYRISSWYEDNTLVR